MSRLALRLAAPIVMVGLAAACGASPTSLRPSSSPKSSPAPSASATSRPGSSAAATAASLSCRLPIVTFPGPTPQPGFISIPGGSFAPDPAGNQKSKGRGLAYDRGYRRWLPVDWRWVSDDGTRYVYATYSKDDPNTADAYSVIHLVTVASGADRVLTRSGQYVINAFSGSGVYMSQWIGGHDGPGPQIGWTLNPYTGAVRALSGGQKYGYLVGSGAGWRDDYNVADPTVHNGMTGPNRLTRVDLATGAEETWFYQQGSDGINLVGFDRQGRPIVTSVVNPGASQVVTIWALTDARHRSQLYSGPVVPYSMMADSNGIWFSDGGATYLYTPASGFRQMASTGGQIAGGCH